MKFLGTRVHIHELNVEYECMKCMLGVHIERVSCVCGVCVCGGLLCDCKKKSKQKRKVLARYTCSV
jgi:hypothetical protein